MNIAVSACLLGENCKYNGGNNFSEKLEKILRGHRVFPVCPEVMGGLPTPRMPSEIVDGVVVRRDGKSVDRAFRKGAEAALEVVEKNEVDFVILQSRSPSCGVREVYDGSFSGTLRPGKGVFAALLEAKGIPAADVEDVEAMDGRRG